MFELDLKCKPEHRNFTNFRFVVYKFFRNTFTQKLSEIKNEEMRGNFQLFFNLNNLFAFSEFQTYKYYNKK